MDKVLSHATMRLGLGAKKARRKSHFQVDLGVYPYQIRFKGSFQRTQMGIELMYHDIGIPIQLPR